MKNLLLFIFVISLALSMCACGKDLTADTQSSSSAPEISNAESDASAFEGFWEKYSPDKNYKSWKYRQYDENTLNGAFSIEIYETDNYTYFSYINQAKKADYIIRYSPDSPDDTVEALCNSKWVKCVNGSRSFGIGSSSILSNALLAEGDTEDGSFEIGGETFKSKHGYREVDYHGDTDGFYVDYLFRNGKWDAIAISNDRSGQSSQSSVVLFEDLDFSDTPSENGRLYSCLHASADDQITASLQFSESMYPTLRAGELYYFQKTDVSSLKAGDIVLAYSEDDQFYMILRIVEIKDGGAGFILRGDQNISNQEEVFLPQNILGVLTEN